MAWARGTREVVMGMRGKVALAPRSLGLDEA